jgi:hypothetical protein
MEPRVAAPALPIAGRPVARQRPHDRSALRHVATVLLALVLLADIAALALVLAVIRATDGPPPSPVIPALLILTASYGVVGWIVASRRPDNRIGWVFLVIGLSLSIEVVAADYAQFGLLVSPGSLPFADIMSWVALWAWAPGFILLVTLSLLLFPDGHPPSPRWRPVVLASFVVMGLLTVPIAIAAWPYRGLAALDLEASMAASADRAVAVAMGIQGLGILASPFVAIASFGGIVVRFRHADQIERQQLRWFGVAAVAVIPFVLSAEFVTPPLIVGFLTSVLIAPLIPAAAAVAILRYRLYDLDRIVSRTIAYATVTGILVVVFAGGILVFQELLAPITGKSGVAVAASTLVAAALFQPLRRKVQNRVDHRFNRARYDAERTVTAFGRRLRDEVDLTTVVVDLDTTVRAAIAPDRVGVWLRTHGR